MTKSRFPKAVSEDLLVRSGRRCCLCQKAKSGRVQVHHIIPQAEGGKGTAHNGIVLCFDCHSDVHAYWGKTHMGRSFTPAELTRRRDNWFETFARTGGTQIDYKQLASEVLRQLAEHGISAALTEVRERAPPPQAESAHPMPVPRAVHIGTEDLTKAKRPGMSLDAPGIVYVGEPFKVTVNADPAPDVGAASTRSSARLQAPAISAM